MEPKELPGPAGRISPVVYRRIVLGAGAMLAVIVASGAAVRLTSSGLGCEDWPTCSADSFAPEWSFHGWVEFGNRLFTGVVSAAVIAAVLAAHFRSPRNRRLILLSWGLVAGVLAQILVGAAVVLLDLSPISVTAHFLISMLLLANAVVLYLAADPRPSPPNRSQGSVALRYRRLHLLLGVAVLVTGTIVTGTGPNSGDIRAERLPFDLGQVARIHSITVWVFLAATITLAVVLRSDRSAQRPLQVLLASILLQGAIGYGQYFTGVPPLLVQFHVMGSIVVWCATVWFYLATSPRVRPIVSNDSPGQSTMDRTPAGATA